MTVDTKKTINKMNNIDNIRDITNTHRFNSVMPSYIHGRPTTSQLKPRA